MMTVPLDWLFDMHAPDHSADRANCRRDYGSTCRIHTCEEPRTEVVADVFFTLLESAHLFRERAMPSRPSVPSRRSFLSAAGAASAFLWIPKPVKGYSAAEMRAMAVEGAVKPGVSK